jgi:pimeloyl-ACP methyl ester carboxylesterase
MKLATLSLLSISTFVGLASVAGVFTSQSDGANEVVSAFRSKLGDKCYGVKPIKRRVFENSSVFVGNPYSPCAVWDQMGKDIVTFSGYVELAGFATPLVSYVRNAAPDTRANVRPTVYLRIPGGPAGRINPSTYDSKYYDALADEDILISLAYTGTSHATLYPKPSFDVACNQVGEYIDRLTKEMPGSDLILIGESLGAHIALCAAKQDNVTRRVKGVILVNPLFYSPNEARDSFLDYRSKHNLLDNSHSVRAIDYRDHDLTGGKRVFVKSHDLFINFFDIDAAEKNLGDWIEHSSLNEVLVIYGSADVNAGIGNISEMRNRFPHLNMNICEIDGMQHKIAAGFSSTISEIVNLWRVKIAEDIC